jgi:hypothetical protein
MPLDDENVLGTEGDGSKCLKYCKYCYQNGLFTDPDMTLDEMRANVVSRMQNMNLGEDLITRAVNVLPYLGRWLSQTRYASMK